MQTESINRRKHKRHTSHEGAFVTCLRKAGRLADISEGGMAITLSGETKSFLVEMDRTFTCRSTSIDIDKLPLELIRRGEVELSRYVSYASQTIGVKFNNLSTIQQRQIRHHISSLS